LSPIDVRDTKCLGVVIGIENMDDVALRNTFLYLTTTISASYFNGVV